MSFAPALAQGAAQAGAVGQGAAQAAGAAGGAGGMMNFLKQLNPSYSEQQPQQVQSQVIQPQNPLVTALQRAAIADVMRSAGRRQT